MILNNKFFIGIIFLLAIIRGSSYLFMKNLIDIVNPLDIIFMRFLGSTIILSLIYYKHLSKINKHELLFGSLAGLFLFIAFSFQIYGLQYTTIYKQSFLTALYIIFIPLLEIIFFKKTFSKTFYYALLPVILGLFLVSMKDIAKIDCSLNLGDYLTIICAIGFALNIIVIGKIKECSLTVDIINITIIQMLIVSILSFFFQLLIEKETIVIYINFSIIYLILVCTIFNFLMQNISQYHVSSQITGLILSLESVFGTIFSILFLKEIVYYNFVIGAIFMMIGIFMVQNTSK